jgi:hypothetical protein
MKSGLLSLPKLSAAFAVPSLMFGVGTSALAQVPLSPHSTDQTPAPANQIELSLPQQFRQPAQLPNAFPGQNRQSLPLTSPLTIFENVTLAPGFSPDPVILRGISGGAKAAGEVTGRASTATGPCVGFIDAQPDHKIVLTQLFSYLRLQIQSSEDTSLVIRGPGGTWCNDDYSGKNPGIAGQWLSGTYEIWVGSPKQTMYAPYVLQITQQKD